MKNTKSEVFNKSEKSLKNEEIEEKLKINENIIFGENVGFHEINNNEENINPIFKNEIDIDLDNLKSVMEKMHNFIEGISELTYQN